MKHQWIIPPPADMIEPSIAPTIYANGPVAVEWLNNGDVCFHFTQRQLPLEAIGAGPQLVTVAHMIRPIAELPAAMVSLSTCLQWQLGRHGASDVAYPGRPPPESGPLRIVG